MRKLHYLTDHLADVDLQYRPAFEEDRDILTLGGGNDIEGILIRLLDGREAVDRAIAASVVNDLLAEP